MLETLDIHIQVAIKQSNNMVRNSVKNWFSPHLDLLLSFSPPTFKKLQVLSSWKIWIFVFVVVSQLETLSCAVSCCFSSQINPFRSINWCEYVSCSLFQSGNSVCPKWPTFHSKENSEANRKLKGEKKESEELDNAFSSI